MKPLEENCDTGADRLFMSEKGKKIRWKKGISRIFAGLLAFMVYVVAGALLPFAFSHKEDQNIISGYHAEDYYSDVKSGDMAYLVEENAEALDLRLNMFEEARESIVISTFDIRDGESFRDMAAALIAAADRGVDVKILVDGMYGMVHMGNEPLFYAVGSHKNITMKYYNKPNVFLPWTFNGRMHDKYIVVDNRTLLAGGRNTFDYFLGEYEKKGKGYDREVLIYNSRYREGAEGSVLFDVQEYFDAIWKKSVCRTEFSKPGFFQKSDVKKEKEALEERYRTLKESGRIQAWDYEKKCVGIQKATFVHNPTGIFSKEPLVWYQMKVLMLNASERIVIQTPYAVFSDEMYQGMRKITERLADTRMLVNSIAVGDNVMASADYRNNRDKLIDTGVQIYEFFGDHSCHAKSLIIDDDLSVIGSYNFDMRSTYVDTETMIVIHGKEFTALLEEKMRGIEEQSLLVKEDGSYEYNPEIEKKMTGKKKKKLIAALSKVIWMVRYLV